jgi:signal transduction histidine kinase/CheY-like chemotaxis protein
MTPERILIADDEPDVLEFCRRILTAKGYEVETVSTGNDAVEKVKQKTFDLLLTDIRMPGLDGLETAQAVKQLSPDITCVTMTGYSTMDTAIEALRLGIDEFIVKPFGPEDLSIAVAKALEKERLRKENIRLLSLVPLFEFNKTLLSTVEVDALLGHVLDLAQRETQSDWAILFLRHGDILEEHVHPPQPAGSDSSRLQRMELGKWVARQKEILVVEHGAAGSEEFAEFLETQGANYLLGIPLIAQEERSLGAIVLAKETTPFASGDSQFLQVMAGQAAIAIENAYLFNEIQQAYEELKKLDHMKSEFINIAAHELRTPLAILLGYASVMAEEATGPDRDPLNVITRNALRLRALIDDMLNLSYLETGQAQLRLEEVVLSELISDAVDDLRQLIEEKSLTVTVTVASSFPVFLADRHKLDLIVMNLLSNAIKYTPEQGQVSFKAWTDNGKILVSLHDTGIGIAVEDQEKIFERFYQVEDSLTRHHSGIGLGLAVAKELVEICKGRIWVESALGEGSTFTFEIPWLRPPGQ